MSLDRQPTNHSVRRSAAKSQIPKKQTPNKSQTSNLKIELCSMHVRRMNGLPLIRAKQQGHNPFSLDLFISLIARVGPSSQHWAGRHNPFGVKGFPCELFRI